MCKKITTHLRALLGFFIFLYNISVLSQEIQAPEIDGLEQGGSICASINDFEFEFDFRYTMERFNDNNNFIVELSDPNGDFSNPSNVNTIFANELNQFNRSFFVDGDEVNFILPEGTAGDAYRIRIRSTDPEVIGEASLPFAAYYEPNLSIDLESSNGTAICNGEPLLLSVVGLQDEFGQITTDNINDYEYAWFSSNNIIDGERGATLEVDTPGIYSVSFYLGDNCSNTASKFDTTIITESDADEVFILGDSNLIELCAGEAYELEASIDNNAYSYTWFKDDEPITQPGYMPILITSEIDPFGVYRLEIDTGSGGCELRSQNEVTIRPKDGANFTITLDSGLRRIILPGEDIVLSAVTNSSNPSLDYIWIKDGVPVSQGTTTATSPEIELNIILPGEYQVQITDNSSECPFAVPSEIFTFLEPVALVPTIRTGELYEECNVTDTVLRVVGVSALASDGEEYPLTADQLEINTFTYQWFKDDVAIAGENSDDFAVNSYEENAVYSLNTSVGAGTSFIDGNSNMENVFLSPGLEIISSSISNKICPGSIINLSIDILDGFEYAWFKDDEELSVDDVSNIDVDEEGIYHVEYTGFDCVNIAGPIEILIFDEEVLVTDPSTTAVLIPGETVTLTASGADTYEWFNENGDLLSSNETLEVSNFGLYTVIGTVEDCDIPKDIRVIEDDGSFIIPNILTPFNLDGVNDTWQIPNKFSFQDSVQVLMYNSRGDEIYNTFDYQNDWPQDLSGFRAGMLFYFKVISEDSLIKAGTISVLE